MYIDALLLLVLFFVFLPWTCKLLLHKIYAFTSDSHLYHCGVLNLYLVGIFPFEILSFCLLCDVISVRALTHRWLKTI